MQGNIVGEKFEDFVLTQIKNRQEIQGKGFGKGTTRSSEEQLYLNNRNAWVKLASGVVIEKSEGIDKLKRVIPTYESFIGDELAKRFILFNTVSSLVTSTDNPNQNTLSNNRSGVTTENSIWNNKAYGLGGTEFGINPPPGITDVQVTCVNRGSIRNATITLTAFNKSQFEIIELLFLRLGYTMMLEWGWDKWLDKDGKLQDTGTTVIENGWFTAKSHQEVLQIIQQKRSDYCGNYDGFMGKVVNFDWTLNSDSNYEIILKLVTVGDVIESLNVNTGGEVLTIEDLKIQSENQNISVDKETRNIEIPGVPEGTKMLQLGIYTTFSYQFLNDISTPKLWSDGNFAEFKNLAFLIKNTPTEGLINTADSSKNSTINFKDSKYQYFVSFKVFMNRVKEYLIPSIKSKDGGEELMLEIDGSINDTLITYSPYIIPFDLTISIFKPDIPDTLDQNSIFINSTIKQRFTEIFDNFPRFRTERNGQSYGRLMNMYLNYDFIAKCLSSNTDDEGKLSLFKFLQAICGGINSSLSNTTKLKPILKDDKIITIVDDNFHQQTPPPKVDGEEIFLNTFGYNTNDNSSNFLRDISFQTNITPELASMITIGATAGGSTTREVDGTAFGNFNLGIDDRYQYEVSDLKFTPTKDYGFKVNEDFEDYISYYKSRNYVMSNVIYLLNQGDDFNEYYVGDERRELKSGDVSKLETYIKDKENKIKADAANAKRDAANKLARNLGAQYVKLFSGTSNINGNFIEETGNTYFSLDDNVVTQTKAIYRAWLNHTNNQFLKMKQISSNQTGFLPLQVGLVLDGLSGMKIYNELLLNQSNILPYYYPNRLKFIITQVNHTITGNDWTTSLDTLSQPKIVSTTKEIERGVVNNIFKYVPSPLINPLVR